MNTNIEHFLDYYVNQPNPRYAVMITGAWGCGKTHFIRKWVDKKAKNIETNKASTLTKPIYVSLFGLSSIQQIDKALTKEIYPIIKSNAYKIGKLTLNAISNVTLNCNLSNMAVGKIFNEANVELDIVSLFQNVSSKKKENQTVIFDDFERCNVKLSDLLGYINNFVEHSNIKVIIICNEKEVQDGEYDRFKEKLIGRYFQLEADIVSAINDFCEILGNPHFLIDHSSLIKDVFKKVGYGNFRSLYQGLQDFSEMLKKLRYDDSNSTQVEFVKRLLVQYIVAYREYPANESIKRMALKGPFIIDWSMINFELSTDNTELDNDTQDDDENRIEEEKLKKKYQLLDSSMFDNTMFHILNSLATGCDISNIINENLNPKETKETIYQKLSRFPSMENDDFGSVYLEALNYIINPSSNISIILQTMSTLLVIDSAGIRRLNDDIISTCLNNIETILREINDFSGMQNLKDSQLDRIITEIEDFSKDARLKLFANNVKGQVQSKIAELEEQEIRKLTNIDNSNFDEVTTMFFSQHDQIESAKYASKPVFNQIDPVGFVKAVCLLNNDNRTKFKSLLLNRYWNFDGRTLFSKFGWEVESLRVICNQLMSISKTKSDIDKWTLKELSRVFDKVASEIETDK